MKCISGLESVGQSWSLDEAASFSLAFEVSIGSGRTLKGLMLVGVAGA